MNLLQSQSSIVLKQKATNVEWRRSFDTHTSQHLDRKIVEIILGGGSTPTSITSPLSPKRHAEFSLYLIKITLYIENQMYKQAKDEEEYFHLLAERIYNLGRVFGNERRRRKKTKNTDINHRHHLHLHHLHHHIANQKPTENKRHNCRVLKLKRN
jgi:hypothetical protein